MIAVHCWILQEKGLDSSRSHALTLFNKRNTSVIEGRLYVTHAGLLRLANRNGCCGIRTEPVLPLCQPGKQFWVFKATVFKSAKCRGFIGYGDAHPGNVSPLIFNHAEMRMAETRAVNRAAEGLRDRSLFVRGASSRCAASATTFRFEPVLTVKVTISK